MSGLKLHTCAIESVEHDATDFISGLIDTPLIIPVCPRNERISSGSYPVANDLDLFLEFIFRI
jgi:hypothetical protein